MAPDTTIPDHALPACCVRIDVGGSPAGSGFFVAPGVVVTCHHVLRLERLSSQEADPELTVVSPSRDTTYVVRDWREGSPTDEDDLAILRVEPADEHPFVLLDTGLRARDELQTYGFPENYPDGAPTSLVAEGWMGSKTDRWLKLAQGQVRPGMSGSPVVNLRTGAVCGVLKRTIDPSQWIGGYAVSVRALLALSPKLGAQNLRHHIAHRDEWLRLLPADEQRLLLSQHSPEAPRSVPSQIIVLTVDQRDDRWAVKATVYDYDRDGERWVDYAALTSVTVDLNTVRALVARLFRDWASRESTARGRVEPGEQIRLLGEILSSALLRAELAERFDGLVDAVEHGWLEVALHFADLEDPDFREFVELPWEHLYIPARPPRADVYLARAPRFAFVRALEATPRTSAPRSGRLSLLVVSAAPPDYPDRPEADTSLARDIESIVAGLRELESPDSLEVAFVTSPGLDGLVQAVGEGVYDVVHYVGFGRFDVPNDRIALDTRVPGRPGYVNAGDFAACFEDVKPRLVVLQACRGAEPVPADLATFGPQLLMRGSEAVIAHQYPVAGELTKKFNRTLYTALADGAALEMAAQNARRKVWMSESESRAFLSPAVFLRNPGGLRLVERRERAARSRVGALSAHA